MDASTATAIASAVVAAVAAVAALLGVGAAFFAQRHASRSADGSLQSAAAAESTAKAATQQADVLQEQWKVQKDDAKPKVEVRVTGVKRDRGVGPVDKSNRIRVGVSLLNLSTRREIVESVSIGFRRQTYNSGPPKTLTTKPHIPIEIEGGGTILELELYFDPHQEVADNANEEATATVGCRFGGKPETAFSVFQ